MNNSLVFGPVPSRRLGQSLGINNIPPKICTYSCVYCQLGRAKKILVDRQKFYDPDDIADAVKESVERALKAGNKIDYLTFVPDGEPTLDLNLKKEIELLKPLGIPVAVITNNSLIWAEEVRESLIVADLVCLKIDTLSESIWRKVNRPHTALNLNDILKGALEFSRIYKGRLITETMLVSGINDTSENIQMLAEYIAGLHPAVAYLAIPVRPPAEKWVRPPDEVVTNRSYQIFNDKIGHVELLTGYEGDAFSFSGNVIEDLLNITAVHPMREDYVITMLKKSGNDWSVIKNLVEQGRLVETEYHGHKFYMRKFDKFEQNGNI